MRCAGLLSKYQQAGVEIDRSGTGKLAEVYPGATVRNWDFDTTNYRVNNEVRAGLLKQIKTQAPWLDTSSFETKMIESSDSFDAMIAALAARAVYQGEYTKPTKDQQAAAEIEGWICLPEERIGKLIQSET
jgi:hypothetical protein